jgi:hypothetical protein
VIGLSGFLSEQEKDEQHEEEMGEFWVCRARLAPE